MSEITAAPGAGQRLLGRALASGGLVLLILIVLGDQLLFGHDLGIGLPLLLIAVVAGILFANRARAGAPLTLLAAVAAALCIAPLAEAPSIPGLAVALTGLAIVAIVASGLHKGLVELPLRVLRLGVLAPVRFIDDAMRFLLAGTMTGAGKRIFRSLIVWTMPLVLALVFLMLFSAANPMIELGLSRFNLESALEALSPVRIAMWIGLAVVLWPVLRPRLFTMLPLPLVQFGDAEPQVGPKPESLIFGRAAILRALIVFNLLFAVQSVLDLTYLWGGTALPEGMTYAGYAHRGAYPLIATALLAAAFVLAAMRPGGVAESSRPIRTLVYLWIAQNVLLVVSSIFRLWLYVEVYALTELRIAAGLWMVLVAAGLVFICVRIATRRSNRWLVAMNLYALGAVVFATAVMDFPAIISRFNVEHSNELAGQGEPLHLYYIESLGPGVIPALDDFITRMPADRSERREEAMAIRDALVAQAAGVSRDWRSWTWRQQRLDDYLGSRIGSVR